MVNGTELNLHSFGTCIASAFLRQVNANVGMRYLFKLLLPNGQRPKGCFYLTDSDLKVQWHLLILFLSTDNTVFSYALSASVYI